MTPVTPTTPTTPTARVRKLSAAPVTREVLEAVLAGDLTLTPTAPGHTAEPSFRVGEPIDPAVALVVATSGTTGIPKGAMLTREALQASAERTHTVLGGPAGWVLFLPPHHIAGLQVLLRSLAAGIEPLSVDVSQGFSLAEFTALATNLRGRWYTSLVPTQLAKILTDPTATAALANFAAILVGGGAANQRDVAAARAAGAHIVLTYGMSETSGGCVYDGYPLPDVQLQIGAAAAAGRVSITGPTLALGYRNFPDHPSFATPGWFHTDDLGTVAADGKLTIVGRRDEAISTGALTVLPQVVERVLLQHTAIEQCAVFGITDSRLGEAVAVAVVGVFDGPQQASAVVAAAAAELPAHARPRQVFTVTELPLRGPGKIDRRALRDRFGQAPSND